MTSEKYKQLTDVHVQHQIWSKELELALMELNFWDELVTSFSHQRNPGQEPGDDWHEETGRLHSFQRLVRQLTTELQSLNKEVADGVQANKILNPETRSGHQYLRQQMDSFHTDFQIFKNEMRQYVIAQPEF
jgi:hypothetical protein